MKLLWAGIEFQTVYTDEGIEMITFDDSGKIGFVINITKPAQADKVITTVFYWENVLIDGQSVRLLRTATSTDPVAVGVPVALNIILAVPLRDVEKVRIDLVKIQTSKEFTL